MAYRQHTKYAQPHFYSQRCAWCLLILSCVEDISDVSTHTNCCGLVDTQKCFQLVELGVSHDTQMNSFLKKF